MSFIRRVRKLDTYYIGPFEDDAIRDQYAEQWLLDPGTYENIDELPADLDPSKLATPYHAAQIEAQPWDPAKPTVHVAYDVFSEWMFMNAD